MIARPKILIALAVGVLLCALSIPVQIMVIYEHGLAELDAVFSKVTTLNWLVIFGGIVCAQLILRASPWTIKAVPALIVLVGLNNWVVGHFQTDFSAMTTALATAAFAALHFPLLLPKVRWLLRNPDKRWWLTPKRRKINAPVFLGYLRQGSLRTETFDISETGAFIPVPSQALESGELSTNQTITVSLGLGSYRQLRCTGRIVRRTSESDKHPAGIGVEFTDLSYSQKRDLRRFLDR